MRHFGRSTPGPIAIAAGFIAGLALVALAGCSNDKLTNIGPGGSTSFKGTISGDGTSGVLTLTVATADPAPNAGFRARSTIAVTGTLQVSGGGTFDLGGTYDDVYKKITVSGAGWMMTDGQTTFGLEGSFTGPAGESGAFSVLTVGAGADTVLVFLGTFTSTSGGVNGVFNFAVRGAALFGTAVDANDLITPLDGTFSATTDSVYISHPDNPTGPPLAMGKINPDGSAAGTYDDPGVNSGTWAALKQ